LSLFTAHPTSLIGNHYLGLYTNMTVDCRSCYIPTCTGSMWHNESGTSSPSQSKSAQQSAKVLADCYVAVSDIAGRQRLRSAHRRQLDLLC